MKAYIIILAFVFSVVANGEEEKPHYIPYHKQGEKHLISKEFADHLRKLIKSGSQSFKGKQPNALPRGLFRIDGKTYSYYGHLRDGNNAYWKSTALKKFWAVLDKNDSKLISAYKPGKKQ